MNVNPYFNFAGRADEAIAFYQKALGAEVTTLMRFREAPEPPPPGMTPEGWGDKVMHAEFRIGATRLMASDGCDPASTGFKGISLALGVATPEEAEAKFNALAEGGTVNMPLAETFFSPAFGTVTDRFGVTWMVVAGEGGG